MEHKINSSSCNIKNESAKTNRNLILFSFVTMILILFVGIYFPNLTSQPKIFQGSIIADGKGETNIELKCRDPSASKWIVNASVTIKEAKMTNPTPDWIMLSLNHYRGGDWHVYDNNIIWAEGAYANVALKTIELDPSKTYEIVVDTDPDDLKWHLQVMEAWR